jgi:hypothetical protein
MTKKYDIQYFTAKVNGKEITLKAYTTDTRNGFCHTVVSATYGIDISATKVSYYNRTWERFRYESALSRAIDKLPSDIQQAVRDQIIDGKAAEEEKAAEEQFQAFKSLHSSLSDENKERLANSGIEMHSEEDMRGVMGLMALMKLMQ